MEKAKATTAHLKYPQICTEADDARDSIKGKRKGKKYVPKIPVALVICALDEFESKERIGLVNSGWLLLIAFVIVVFFLASSPNNLGQ